MYLAIHSPDTNPNGIPLVLFGLLGYGTENGTLVKVKVTNPKGLCDAPEEYRKAGSMVMTIRKDGRRVDLAS